MILPTSHRQSPLNLLHRNILDHNRISIPSNHQMLLSKIRNILITRNHKRSPIIINSSHKNFIISIIHKPQLNISIILKNRFFTNLITFWQFLFLKELKRVIFSNMSSKNHIYSLRVLFFFYLEYYSIRVSYSSCSCYNSKSRITL